MEDSPVKVLSRKRKKAPPSNALIGVQTRSKTQIHSHHNRSGIFRSDPIPTQPADSQSPKPSPELNRTPDITSLHVKQDEKELPRSPSNAVEESVDPDPKNGPMARDDVVNSSAESKRVLNRCGKRKVFNSPSSFSFRRLLPYLTGILNDDSSAPKMEIVDARIPHKLQKLDRVNSNEQSLSGNAYTTCIDHTSSSGNGEIPKIEDEVVKPQNLSGSEGESGMTQEIMRPVEVELRCNENAANGNDATAAECCQNTPPELDISTKTKFGSGDSMEVDSTVVEIQDCKGLSIGSEKSVSLSDKPGTNSRNGQILNPLSQLMLFKNPGSLSYRRLLPFLMEISEDNTSASKIIRSPVPPVATEEELLPESSAVAEENCENSHEKQAREEPIQKPSDDNDQLLDFNTRLSPSVPNPSNDYSTNLGPSLVTSKTPPDPCGPNVSQLEVIQPPQSIPKEFEPCFDRENSPSAPSPSAIDNDAVDEEHTSDKHENAAKQSMQSYTGQEQNNNENLVHKVNLDEGSTHSGAHDGLVTPIRGPLKGILKRNRLGCRGLCNCLNCSSFRLHAGRAFEFSRNQMHDAEEVALELMKELANLRNLLEKSVCDDNGLATSKLDSAHINEACKRAMEAESLAKERLSQLNDDLNVHCRIPVLLPPRVAFSNHISVFDTSTRERKS